MLVLLVAGVAVDIIVKDIEESIKTPLTTALGKYDDQATEGSPMWNYKQAWNEIQKEVKLILLNFDFSLAILFPRELR